MSVDVSADMFKLYPFLYKLPGRCWVIFSASAAIRYVLPVLWIMSLHMMAGREAWETRKRRSLYSTFLTSGSTDLIPQRLLKLRSHRMRCGDARGGARRCIRCNWTNANVTEAVPERERSLMSVIAMFRANAKFSTSRVLCELMGLDWYDWN